MKAWVFGLPSARLAKLRLKLVTMVLRRVGSSVLRSHWPMQGPQAFAITFAPASRRVSSRPSRSAVARTRVLPGMTISSAFGFRPASRAYRATEAARERSW